MSEAIEDMGPLQTMTIGNLGRREYRLEESTKGLGGRGLSALKMRRQTVG